MVHINNNSDLIKITCRLTILTILKTETIKRKINNADNLKNKFHGIIIGCNF